MKPEISQILEKCSNIKFLENPSSGSRDVTDRRTNGHDEANSHCSQFCESTYRRKTNRMAKKTRHNEVLHCSSKLGHYYSYYIEEKQKKSEAKHVWGVPKCIQNFLILHVFLTTALLLSSRGDTTVYRTIRCRVPEYRLTYTPVSI
jgi:hypothetical protein